MPQRMYMLFSSGRPLAQSAERGANTRTGCPMDTLRSRVRASHGPAFVFITFFYWMKTSVDYLSFFP